MEPEKVQISGETINRLTRLLSKIKKLDVNQKYKLANVAKLNGRAVIVYQFHAQLLVKQQAQINWMSQIILFCQVYFQKYILDKECRK